MTIPRLPPGAREIAARRLVAHVRQPDTWFGLQYNMNLYRGCQHRCIYCDSRSQCYGIDGFDREILVKANAIERLRDELPRKRVRGTIGLGSMNDPYMPIERAIGLTRNALEVIAEMGFGVHVLTKSDLVLRDADVLAIIARREAVVTFTVTTADDGLARLVEPGAPSVSARMSAMRAIAEHGVRTGVALMPVLPYIEDTEENVLAIVDLAIANGASYVLPGLGVTLRDRQRAYFYARLDEQFPGVRREYERAFGGKYYCPARHSERLAAALGDACARAGLAMRVTRDDSVTWRQAPLL